MWKMLERPQLLGRLYRLQPEAGRLQLSYRQVGNGYLVDTKA